MKRFAAFILLLFVFALPVRADYQTAYNDYLYNYNLYRSAYSNYQVAKSTYNTYRTLTSQNDAILKLRAVLSARNQLMFVYYDLLTEKLNVTPEVSNDYKNTFFNINTKIAFNNKIECMFIIAALNEHLFLINFQRFCVF